ncbi:MAG TPA: hypothetical protein VJN69_08200 [Candidatus Acidoferrales bacterium]|nr:hypothetical protein [Candidatus Acidoferrales bacterium]
MTAINKHPAFLCISIILASSCQAQLSRKPKQSIESMYVITDHKVIYDDKTNSQLDNYVITYGPELLIVQYTESQISTLKPGASELDQVLPGENLHLHARYGSWPHQPDVSQVPQVGVPIRACEMDTEDPSLNDGHPLIATQSASLPCMSRDGDTLHLSIAPNGGIKMWEYVNFDILEERQAAGVSSCKNTPLSN